MDNLKESEEYVDFLCYKFRAENGFDISKIMATKFKAAVKDTCSHLKGFELKIAINVGFDQFTKEYIMYRRALENNICYN